MVRAASAAAAVVVAVGAFLLNSTDGDSDRTVTVDQPDLVEGDRDVAGESVGGTTSTSVGAADPWDFGITVIEVEAGNAVAASEDSAWVAANGRAVLSKIDLDTNAVVSVVEIPAGGRTATFGFGSVWVGHDDGTVSRIDAESGALIATIEVGDAHPSGSSRVPTRSGSGTGQEGRPSASTPEPTLSWPASMSAIPQGRSWRTGTGSGSAISTER